MFRKKSYVIPVTTQNCKDKHLGKRKNIVFEIEMKQNICKIVYCVSLP